MMIEIERTRTPAGKLRVEMLAVPLRGEGEPGPELAALDAGTRGRLIAEMRQRCAEPGKRGATFVWQTHGEMPQELIA
ncbi:MAG: hypothetical protein ACKOCT_08450, partial [Alphaproteobacteria bacterium]